MIVGGLVGFAASGGAIAAVNPGDLAETLKTTSAISDPTVRQMTEVAIRTEFEMSESLRAPRAAVLFLLSFVCGLVVVSAMRLLYPAGLPRSGMRRITGGALLFAGVLRTMEGAIQLVVAQRTAAAFSKLDLPPELSGPVAADKLMSGAVLVLTVGWTVVLVGALVGVGQYLRSDRAKKIVAAADGAITPGSAGR